PAVGLGLDGGDPLVAALGLLPRLGLLGGLGGHLALRRGGAGRYRRVIRPRLLDFGAGLDTGAAAGGELALAVGHGTGAQILAAVAAGDDLAVAAAARGAVEARFDPAGVGVTAGDDDGIGVGRLGRGALVGV